ncbi:MAG: methyltransferase domain-containing protein [Gammaproteobacteria bacterium]|nr:methyltransferase domain-containing protein [Gammaproteobacteria bacterium]
MNVVATVLERYSKGAKARETELCCPVSYDPQLLKLLPQEIIERDYGCGDPSRYVREGDTVLDLGSGGGKVCYLAAQLVGERGRVIGVDMNDDMVALARKYQSEMARKLGDDRVRFVKAYIQDLALDLEAVDRYLARHPLREFADVQRFEVWKAEQRRSHSLIADASVDLVISNCVLNLVNDTDKTKLFREFYRVLKPGGRVAISDIVSDESVPLHLKDDPELWTGCVSGAFQEEDLLRAFTEAGFLAVCYAQWAQEPWRVIDDIEFRSVTLMAVKGEATPCLDIGHAVIYRGPFSSVTDDEGHVYARGARIAVCERTFRLLTQGPYLEQFIGITPAVVREPVPWCAPAGTRRPAAETKGAVVSVSCSTGCCS